MLKFAKVMFDYDKGYDDQIKFLLVNKERVDNLRCHAEENAVVTGVRTTKTKVLSVKCPVDVVLRGAEGDELVRIENQELKFALTGLEVLILDGQKYIALPADLDYTVELTAFDGGEMEYGVMEIEQDGVTARNVIYPKIPLEKGAAFSAQIPAGENIEVKQYAPDGDAAGIAPRVSFARMDGAEVPAYTPGDVNFDGKVNSTDARTVLRAAAKLETLTDEQALAADVDGSGKVNSADSRRILRAAAKLEPLPAAGQITVG